MLYTISLSSSYVNIKLTENSKNVPRYVRNIKKTGENPKFLGNNLFISPCYYYKNHQVEQEIDQTNSYRYM